MRLLDLDLLINKLLVRPFFILLCKVRQYLYSFQTSLLLTIYVHHYFMLKKSQVSATFLVTASATIHSLPLRFAQLFKTCFHLLCLEVMFAALWDCYIVVSVRVWVRSVTPASRRFGPPRSRICSSPHSVKTTLG